MSKRKGYRFARFAPFPLGNLGVSVVRNTEFDPSYPLHRAQVSVFMPPMKDVTITVTSQNAGRFHLSTDGMLPIINHKFDKGLHYLYLADKDRQVSPFSIANVFDNGEVCWGPNGMPFSLRAAWEEFFTRPFNTDLTPIKDRDETEEQRSQIIHDFREKWIEENGERLEPWIVRRLRIPSIDRFKRNGFMVCAYGGDVDRPLGALMRQGILTDSRQLLTGYAPHKCSSNLIGRFPYHYADGSVDMVYCREDHGVKDFEVANLLWSPNTVRQRVQHIAEIKRRVEHRRRIIAADQGKTWSGFAAHDTTWVAMLRYEQKWIDKWRMVGHGGNHGTLEKQHGVGYGWRKELARRVMDEQTLSAHDHVEYHISDYARNAFCWRLRIHSPMDVLGLPAFISEHDKQGNNPHRSPDRLSAMSNAKFMIDRLNKYAPRQLRRFYRRWVSMWMKAQYIASVYHNLTTALDARMMIHFGDPSQHNIDFGSIVSDDGLGYGLKASIKRHFLGKWRSTLAFREMSEMIAPVNQQTFFDPSRFDGIAYVPLSVYNNARPGFLDPSRLKCSQLRSVVSMPACFVRGDETVGFHLRRGVVADHATIPGLYKRFMDYSVALVQMFWCHDDSIYLYDGRWRMIRVPDGATVGEVERMAKELDNTEQWGAASLRQTTFNADHDGFCYSKLAFVPDTEALTTFVNQELGVVPVS